MGHRTKNAIRSVERIRSSVADDATGEPGRVSRSSHPGPLDNGNTHSSRYSHDASGTRLNHLLRKLEELSLVLRNTPYPGAPIRYDHHSAKAHESWQKPRAAPLVPSGHEVSRPTRAELAVPTARTCCAQLAAAVLLWCCLSQGLFLTSAAAQTRQVVHSKVFARKLLDCNILA